MVRARGPLLCVVVLAVVLADASAAASAEAVGSLRASTLSGFAGERVTFTGTLPPKRSRPMALQRKSGRAWVVVRAGKTTKSGRFSLSTTIRSSSTTYRVYAKATRLGAKRYAAAATSTRTIRTRQRPASPPLPASSTPVQLGAPGSPSAPPADTDPPPIPSGLTATAADAQVRLGWDAVNMHDLAGYIVYRTESPSGPWTAITRSPITSASFVATGLSNAITYWFAVSSVDTTGNASTLSQARSAMPLAPVTRLQITSRFSTVLQLDWDNPPLGNAAKVVIRRAAGSNAPTSPTSGTEVALTDPAASNIADTGLAPATVYSYAVFVIADGQAWAPVAAVSGSTTDGSPAPGALPASTVTLPEAAIAASVPGDDGQVTITVNPGVDVPPAGGHVIIAPSSDFPGGMVAEVLSVDGRTVVVGPGSLAETLPNTRIDQDHDITLAPITSATDDGLARMGTRNGKATLALAADALDCKLAGGEATDPGDLFESGNPLPISVEFSNYHWIQAFDPGSLFPARAPMLLLQLTGEADITAKLKAKVPGFSCELSPTWRRQHRLFRAQIGAIPMPPPAPPIPVTMNVEIGLDFGVDGQAGVSMTVHRYWGVKVHKYADEPMVTSDTIGSSDPPKFTVSAGVKAHADLFADLSIMTGGGYKSANAQAGVYGTFGPFFEADASVDQAGTACLTADVGFKMTIGVRLELWVKRWDLELGDATLAKKRLLDKCADLNPDAGTDNTPTLRIVSVTARVENSRDVIFTFKVTIPHGLKLWYSGFNIHCYDASGHLYGTGGGVMLWDYAIETLPATNDVVTITRPWRLSNFTPGRCDTQDLWLTGLDDATVQYPGVWPGAGFVLE